MKLTTISPAKSLNKAYQKQRISRQHIDLFKSNLQKLFQSMNENESEEHLKNIVADFLKETYYKDVHYINTKDHADLVIHNGKTSSDPVGVIIEAKKPSNKLEMVSKKEANVKALHELVLYYLRERIDGDNHEIKYLIVTNIYEWFIFDAVWFEKHIYRNTKLCSDYKDLKVSGHDTKYFYENIAAKHLDALESELSCTYFDLKDYEKNIYNAKTGEDNKLVELYKILSPEHLFKEPFVNDSNSLNKEFYNELLHILGLQENKEGGKKLIGRKPETERDEGSLIENTLRNLTIRDRLKQIDNLAHYGATEEEQLFSIALELCITWLNRVLFLKLLEGQLVIYHKGDEQYSFLTTKRISNYVDLNELFFEVLALPEEKRSPSVKKKFGDLPYLNSSLFEETTLESTAFPISELKERHEILIYSGTVLKDTKGKRITGTKNTLQYLLEFLEAFDFSSEGKGIIQEQNKSIINASVLGLIFEKINGYKDGSYFTPGFITMYMCRETLRKAVVQKFRDSGVTAYQKVETFEDLQDAIEHTEKEKRTEANKIVNSLKVCDPAVGSGHFLVSALNELIAIKSDLHILNYQDNSRVKGCNIVIENDELIISDKETDELFEYTLNKNNKPIDDLQNLQEALFHEKQILIENCLFGVDINPKSVMICRLRLWIELLKHSYYTKESKYQSLETLPNIDINIKCGNSLISRFDVLDDYQKLPTLTKQKIREATRKYKDQVVLYKCTDDKKVKQQAEKAIARLKEEFSSITNPLDKDYQWLKTREAELLEKQSGLFATANREDWGNEINVLSIQYSLLKQKYEAKQGILYNNAFEWRFEFPEVLDDDGKYLGFDVVVGNPPYIPLEDIEEAFREFYRKKYARYVERKFETSVLFIIEGFNILHENGSLAYIAPVTWQTGENYSLLRKYIIEKRGIAKIINLPFDVFIDAYVETAIYYLYKTPNTRYDIFSFDKKETITSLNNINFTSIKIFDVVAPKYKLILNPFIQNIFKKFDQSKFTTLGKISISTQGLAGSSFQKCNKHDGKKYYKFLNKGNVYNYSLQIEDTYFTSLEELPSLKTFYDAKPKILIRRIVNRQDRLSVGYTDKKMVFKKDINPFVIDDKDYDTKFVLALMASKLISFIYLNISTISSKDDFRQTTLGELREIPIPITASGDQKRIIKLVDKILEKKQESPAADTSALENKIDEMVYELYGLTPEEIAIVEGKS